MDLTRRGFMAAITSTLATAVPVATALVVIPKPKVEPEIVRPEYVEPVRLGACGVCEHWTIKSFGSRNYMNRMHGNGRIEGACLNMYTEIGITSIDFGCTLFRQKLPPPPLPRHTREDWHSIGMSYDMYGKP